MRRDIAAFEEYKPVVSAWDLKKKQKKNFDSLTKLDAGENTFGPSPKVKKTLGEFAGYQYYPDPEYKELRKMLAAYTNVSYDSVVVGNGGDEIIDLLTRLTLEPGDEIINLTPTFSSYALSTKLSHGKVIIVPRGADYEVDINAVYEAVGKRTKIIFLCNPNNPTGNITPISTIEKLLQLNALVVVDEAYFEFCGESAAPLVKKYKNLVIIRTLSKWAGIAGLRAGYALMNENLAREIMKIKPPYNLNTAAEVAARAALSDVGYYKKIIKAITKERERLALELQKTDAVKVWPSGGNFIYLEMTESKLRKLKKESIREGVSLRYYTGAARITVGRPEQNEKVIKIFKKI